MYTVYFGGVYDGRNVNGQSDSFLIGQSIGKQCAGDVRFYVSVDSVAMNVVAVHASGEEAETIRQMFPTIPYSPNGLTWFGETAKMIHYAISDFNVFPEPQCDELNNADS